MTPYWKRPCAGIGYLSFRYRGDYGWIMLGAIDVQDALNEAARSIGYAADPLLLQQWDAALKRYVAVAILPSQ